MYPTSHGALSPGSQTRAAGVSVSHRKPLGQLLRVWPLLLCFPVFMQHVFVASALFLAGDTGVKWR